ncbi:RagB/SusD family nutrient uptake outer membrane protein [uncultured Bacteroides sp.]|uniref:RagB/SusD family nutrient uptake outer membrane protein n=1 Tax=uncultured Bacteroides sp. TaxID=162156 RepID=UPI0025CD3A6D|nr:RagB/SusD family nutrient uptake outer membrane protein [uncultured Bacteroides sp.]
MKMKYITASLLSTALLSLTGCVGDLDVFPLDEKVVASDKAYSDAESYTKALNKIYSVWALSGQDGANSSDISGLDPGNTVLLRCWWTLQENTTDEAKCAWPDSWVASINGLTWGTAQVESIEGAYQRSMYVVALVNDFMKNVGNAPAEINKEEYAAEARFCRALAYYALMDLFGRPPFITENNYALAPSQLSREELFDWIEGELLELRGQLPAKYKQYGRADQAAVDALLARMYLNAETYTGDARYTDCVERCKNVIAGGYQLADNYAELFMADNGENANAVKEIIFPIMADGNTTQSYGIGAIILGSRSSSESSPETYGCSSGWDGFRSTGNLVRNFEFPNDDESTWTADNILDKRGIFYDANRSLDITTKASGTFTSEGWAVYKYTNKNSDGTNGKNVTFPDTDFPMFRLADIYLMYAEAVARGGEGGSLDIAVGYINELRDRGYGDENHRIDANWLTADAAVSGGNTRVKYGNILNERARELYWEGTRRMDLIRFGLFTSGSYVWAEKGGIITGVGVDDKYRLFPIPQTDMSVNGNLTQNTGY